MTVVWASRKVGKDGAQRLQLRYDAGDWTIEAIGQKETTVLKVAPATMDQLVEEWPKIRADVEGGKKK